MGLLNDFARLLRVPPEGMEAIVHRAFRILADEARPTDAPERLAERIDALIEVLQTNKRAYLLAERVYRGRLGRTTARCHQALGEASAVREACRVAQELLRGGDVTAALSRLEEVTCSPNQ